MRMGFDMRIKHLTLKTSVHPFEFIGIGFLLNSSPYLETLTLDIGPRRIFGVSINKNAQIHRHVYTYIFGLELKS